MNTRSILSRLALITSLFLSVCGGEDTDCHDTCLRSCDDGDERCFARCMSDCTPAPSGPQNTTSGN